MKKRYAVKSGRPAGEVHDWDVFQCANLKEAQEARAWMTRYSRTLDAWLWGPHIYPLDDGEMPLAWDGFKMVEAPKWTGVPA